jgi:DNA-directed RNA polymerase specialized sigma24 family protein
LEHAVHEQTRERYLLALKRLRPEERNVIIARLEMGYSYEQLALVVDKPTAEAARLAVRRALFRLAREMERA